MTIPFRSPGSVGIPDQTEQVSRTSSGGYDLSTLRPRFHPRKLLASGQASMFRPGGRGTAHLEITVRGMNTVYNHLQAVDALIPGAIGIISTVTGDFVTTAARDAMLNDFGNPIWWTGNTYRSIHPRLGTTPTVTSVTIGPTTFYSPLIEFGLGPHFPYGPRPFMTQAYFTVLPHHIRALQELARVVSGPDRGITQEPYAKGVNSWLRGFRNWLYTKEKQIGDVVPLGAPTQLNKLRGGLINMARSIGDIQSVLGRTVGSRFVRRLEGKVTGRLIGIGAHSVFTQRTVGASIGGGQRAYNRFAGRYASRFMGQNKLFGGLGG